MAKESRDFKCGLIMYEFLKLAVFCRDMILLLSVAVLSSTASTATTDILLSKFLTRDESSFLARTTDLELVTNKESLVVKKKKLKLECLGEVEVLQRYKFTTT